jgi:hypothetical protein
MGLLSKIRRSLYSTAKILGDVDAVAKGNIVKRVRNRITGKIAGKILKKINK